MSYFLCLALPKRASKKMLIAFHPSIHFTDVSAAPIGRATKGKKETWDAYLLQIGSSSASLVGKGSARKNARVNDHKEYFALGVQELLETEKYLSISFLVHWMHGYIENENVTVLAEEQIGRAGLSAVFLNLKEDVKYLVSNV